MREVIFASRYKKDLKRRIRDPRFRVQKLKAVLSSLIHGRELAEKHKNHALTGEYRGCFECHVQPDVLLIYLVDVERNILYLLRIGSHAELFG
jgi:mRNA interferase YafQ